MRIREKFGAPNFSYEMQGRAPHVINAHRPTEVTRITCKPIESFDPTAVAIQESVLEAEVRLRETCIVCRTSSTITNDVGPWSSLCVEHRKWTFVKSLEDEAVEPQPFFDAEIPNHSFWGRGSRTRICAHAMKGVQRLGYWEYLSLDDLFLTAVDASSYFDNMRRVDMGDLIMQIGRPVLLVPHRPRRSSSSVSWLAGRIRAKGGGQRAAVPAHRIARQPGRDSRRAGALVERMQAVGCRRLAATPRDRRRVFFVAAGRRRSGCAVHDRARPRHRSHRGRCLRPQPAARMGARRRDA